MNIYKEFIDSFLIPKIEEEFSNQGSSPPHIVLIITKKERKERSAIDKILKYDEDEGSNMLYSDTSLKPPHDLVTYEHIIKNHARQLFPEAIITSDLNKTPHRQLMDDFFKMFQNQMKPEELNNEIVINLESYEGNERYLYKYERGRLLFIEDLTPLERLYLPYLN